VPFGATADSEACAETAVQRGVRTANFAVIIAV